MKVLKYIFRFIFVINIIVFPGMFIKQFLDKGDFLLMGIWIIILICNLYCLWEYIKTFNKE